MCQKQWYARKVVKLLKFVDLRGALVPVPFDILPFEPKHMFYIYGVPDEHWRGAHAHKKAEQLIICINGQIDVWMEDCVNFLDVSDAIYIPSMVWSKQQFFHNAIALVLCSHPYDESDYIRNYEEYTKCASCLQA